MGTVKTLTSANVVMGIQPATAVLRCVQMDVSMATALLQRRVCVSLVTLVATVAPSHAS